jgi:hypothetical protein
MLVWGSIVLSNYLFRLRLGAIFRLHSGVIFRLRLALNLGFDCPGRGFDTLQSTSPRLLCIRGKSSHAARLGHWQPRNVDSCQEPASRLLGAQPLQRCRIWDPSLSLLGCYATLDVGYRPASTMSLSGCPSNSNPLTRSLRLLSE